MSRRLLLFTFALLVSICIVVAEGGCPDNMVAAKQGVCIDKYEAHLIKADGSAWPYYRNPSKEIDTLKAQSLPGVKPQGYISGVDSKKACENARKRLCSLDEWMAACQGGDPNRIFPYGNERIKGACNDETIKRGHPISVAIGPSGWAKDAKGRSYPKGSAMADPRVLQHPDNLKPTGSFPQCVSPVGAFDMMGNLHEWIDDPKGTFKGGFMMDTEINGVGCNYRTTAHSFSHWDYSTGFRCCSGAGANVAPTVRPTGISEPGAPVTAEKLDEDGVIDVKYPSDGGAIWIPKEIKRGKSYPLFIMLSGGDGSNAWIGPGKQGLEGIVRKMMDRKRVFPMILVAPSGQGQHGSFSKDTFEMKELLGKVNSKIKKYGISVNKDLVAIAGHGAGAAFDDSSPGAGGVYGVVGDKQARPILAIALLDGSHTAKGAMFMHNNLDGSGTKVIAYAGKNRDKSALPAEWMTAFLGQTVVECGVDFDSDFFIDCEKSGDWYSYVTIKGGPADCSDEACKKDNRHVHSTIPFKFFNDWLPRLFPPNLEAGEAKFATPASTSASITAPAQGASDVKKGKAPKKTGLEGLYDYFLTTDKGLLILRAIARYPLGIGVKATTLESTIGISPTTPQPGSPAAVASQPTTACADKVPGPGGQLDSSKSFSYDGIKQGRQYHLDPSKKGNVDGSELSYACAPDDTADCRWFKQDGSVAGSKKVTVVSGFSGIDGKICFTSIGGAMVPARCYDPSSVGELFYYKYRDEEPNTVQYERAYAVDSSKTATRFDDAGNQMGKVKYACAGDSCMFFRDSFNRLASGIIRLDSGFGSLDGKYCMTNGYGNLRREGGTDIDSSKCVSSVSEASKIPMWPELSWKDMAVLTQTGSEQDKIPVSGEPIAKGRVTGGTRWSSTGSDARLFNSEGRLLWINLIDVPFTGIVYVTEGDDAGKFILVKKGEFISGSARSSQAEVEAQYPSLGAPYYTPEYVNRDYCSGMQSVAPSAPSAPSISTPVPAPVPGASPSSPPPPTTTFTLSTEESKYDLKNGIKVKVAPYGEITLNPGIVCAPGNCKEEIIKGKGVGSNPKDTLVIHATVGGSAQSTRDFFASLITSDKSGKRKQVGTQWILGRDGESIQATAEETLVFHAPGVSRRAIGIEVANAVDECGKICRGKDCSQSDCVMPPDMDSSRADVQFWMKNNKMGRKNERYSQAQMKALLKLSAEIVIRHKMPISNVIRHVDQSMKSGKGHHDPGPLFDWDKFRSDLQSVLDQYESRSKGGVIA
ncbi:MAG: N-acetylmuramoyl-L-alanine amidase [Candidatus Nanoarchaeia archaeon]